MCNLYSMTKDKGALRGLFGIPDNRAYAVEPKNAIFPRYKAPTQMSSKNEGSYA